MELPTGYAETMDKLRRPDNWDVPGVIADISDDLRRSTDCGAALAVIDTLVFRMKEIAECISSGHAKQINPTTIRKAAEIAATFASKPIGCFFAEGMGDDES